MFTALSSLLPPLLQGGPQEKDKPPPPRPSQDTSEHTQSASEPEPDEMTTDDPAAKKRKERTHESFIVVRPPPSKSNHPLNLQVQLVPPTGRQPTIIRRSESTDSEFGNVPLSRTNSNRSDISAYSSVTSLSTVSSTSTTGSGRRMIIPLYNLQAHNVMTNVIVDAGTDAKIAKFMKRGLEIIGLCVLEPIEITGGARYEDVSGPAYNSALLSADLPRTPTSSHLSLNSDNPHESMSPPPMPTSPLPQPDRGSSGGARRLFGKVFRRKENPPQNSPNAPTSPLPQLEGRSSKRSSLLLDRPIVAPVHGLAGAEPPATPTMPTVLGIQPTLRSSSPVAGTATHKLRPTSYVWVMRKWLKEPPNGASAPADALVEIRLEWTRAAHVARARNASGSSTTNAQRRKGAGSILASSNPSTSSLGRKTTSPATSPTMARRSLDRERSPSPRHSIRTSTTSTESGSPPPPVRVQRQEDDGEESDPEDSETPWTCHLVVRRLHRTSSSQLDGPASSSSSSAGDVRVKVGAVVPAPHHPKVVALLKIPFPLPDVYLHSRWTPTGVPKVEIDARRRVVTPSGVARPAATDFGEPGTPTQAAVRGEAGGAAGIGKFAANAGSFISAQSKALRNNLGSAAGGLVVGSANYGVGNGNGHGSGLGHGHGETMVVSGMLLSAEEIKDVVCCTALWVVVREAFGGVGRVTRKGDGWRIRG